MSTIGTTDDVEYHQFLQRVNARLAANTQGGQPLFTTDAGGLFEGYLAALPEDQRQHHQCRACKTFIERFGGLVTIDATGKATTAVWNVDDAPDLYKPSATVLAKAVNRAKVTGVFLSGDKVWGTPKTGVWQHLSVGNPTPWSNLVLDAHQKMAEKKEDFRLVLAALQEFPESAVDQALPLLRNDQLYRSEKVLGVAEWFKLRHGEWKTLKGPAKTNAIWRAVATAPAGFCHIRSGMIGTLLEDIVAGLPFDDVSKKFAAKMHPLQYLRPQAAPSEGNVAAAEKIITQLKASGALDRRYAGIDDMADKLWAPKPAAPAALEKEGVFGHVKTKAAVTTPEPLSAPPVTLTWEKFSRTVLPVAEDLAILVPTRGDFRMFVTAANPDAPPILQWDTPEQRNPVSSYVWHGGTYASDVGLAGTNWARVTAVVAAPAHWFGRKSPNHSKRPHLLLEGAAETRRDAGLALFPETLSADLHSVRRTIEQFSRQGKLGPATSAPAVGLPVVGATIKVKVAGQVPTVYTIDRLD